MPGGPSQVREQICEALQASLGEPDQDEKLAQLKNSLTILKERSPDELLKVIGFFGDNQIALRAFYTDAVGDLIITALKLLAKCANSTRFVDKPGLTILRALEGIVLMYIEDNQSQRKDIADFLHDVLRSRKLPPQALCRVETALWYLHPSPSLQTTPAPEPRLKNGDGIDSDAGAALEQRLLQLLQGLRPSPAKRERWEAGFGKVNAVLNECFGVEGKLFGSAVNGFELATSDLDVVVPLPPATIEALLTEKDKTGSVQVTPKEPNPAADFPDGDTPKAAAPESPPGAE